MVKVGDTFDSFVVKTTKTANALQDFEILTEWFKEAADRNHQDTVNELYHWFCNEPNKGSLAFYAMSQKKG